MSRCAQTGNGKQSMYYDRPSLGQRLARLPGQLLLALINATALLVIVACVLAIVVLNRVDNAGSKIAGNLTDAALARLQVSPEEFKTKLVALDSKIEQISNQLANPDEQDHWEVAQQLKELNRNLADVKTAAQGLSEAGPQVTNAIFKQAGTTLTDALFALRGCANDPGQVTPGS